MSDKRQSPQTAIVAETPAKRMANLFKRMVRENDQRERAAAMHKPQPKERDRVNRPPALSDDEPR
jgi:hypothetical protein